MIEHWLWLRPSALWLLLLTPLIHVFARRVLRSEHWASWIDPELRAIVVTGQDKPGKQANPWLTSALWFIACVALAGPSWQKGPAHLLKQEDALIVAVDLSSQAMATDLSPNRLTHMRFELADLIRARTQGQLGLIAYSEEAFTVAPLTDDATTLSELSRALTPNIMPVDGQQASSAIKQAVQMLERANFDQGRLLLVTNQVDDHAQYAAQEAAIKGLTVSVLGIGTKNGAPITRPGGGFVRQADGQLALAKLDEAALKTVADAGGGRYQRAQSGDADVTALGVLSPATGQTRAHTPSEQQQDEAQAIDGGIWLVFALMLLLLPRFRKNAMLSVACLMFVGTTALITPNTALADDNGTRTSPTTAPAERSFSKLFKNKEQRAWQALHNQQPKQASALSERPNVQAAAAYRSGDHKKAAELYAQDPSIDGQYNLGNARAQLGELDAAIDAYQQVLAKNPNHEDAKHNLALLEQMKKQQQQQQQQQQDDSSSSDDANQDSSQNGESSDEQQDPSGDKSQSNSDDAKQDGSDDSNQDASSEKQDNDDQQSSKSASDSEQNQNDNTDASQADAESEAQSESNDNKDAEAQAEQDLKEAMNEAMNNNTNQATDDAENTDETSQEESDAEAQATQQQMAQPTQAEPSDEEAGTTVQLSPEELEALQKKQRMERVLEKIPDDPSALLRRKFQIEHARRQRGEQTP